MSDQFYVPKSQKGVFGNATAWVIGILILVGLIAAAVFVIRTVTAGPAGRSGAFRQKESAQNRVFAQANFEQLNADVHGYVAKVRYALDHAERLIVEAKAIDERRVRYAHVAASKHPAIQEIMRIADGREDERGKLVMRCWLMAQPEPTAPFARSEAVA